MAGTILFELRSLHTYQRSLRGPKLDEALRDAHLYIISKRPKSIVRPKRFLWLRSAVVETTGFPGGERWSLPVRSVQVEHIKQDGSYWDGRVDDHVVHGEAWHLGALLSGRNAQVCAHEVLYVGQAFGVGGKQNVGTRTSKHSTLQKIYEDYQRTDYEIYVTPLIVPQGIHINDDHIDDDGGLDMGLLNSRMSAPVSAAGATVNLLEQLLIAYFKPQYNKKLREWNPQPHHKALVQNGYRLIIASLQGLHELPQFLTEARPQARMHQIAAEIPGVASPTMFKIGTLDELEESGAAIELMRLVLSGMAARADSEPGMMQVFGRSPLAPS